MAALTDMHERQVNVAPAGTWSLERFAAGKLSGGPSQRTWKEGRFFCFFSCRQFYEVKHDATACKMLPPPGVAQLILRLCCMCRAAKFAETLKLQLYFNCGWEPCDKSQKQLFLTRILLFTKSFVAWRICGHNIILLNCNQHIL